MKKEAVYLQDLVTEILRVDKKAREDDNHLYQRVLYAINPKALCMPVGQFLAEIDKLHVPTLDCVTRTRRKVQEWHPEFGMKDKERKRTLYYAE